VYVPRALRPQNAASANIINTAKVADRTASASEAVDVSAQLHSADANDSSPGAVGDPSSAAMDNEFSNTLPDCNLQFAKSDSCRNDRKPKKVGCQDGVKKVSKSVHKSKSVKPHSDDKDTPHVSKSYQHVDAGSSKVLTADETVMSSYIQTASASSKSVHKSKSVKPHSDDKDTPHVVSKSCRLVDAGSSKVLTADETVTSYHVQSVSASAVGAGSKRDVDNCRQSSSTLTDRSCTVSESTDADLLNQKNTNCRTVANVTFDDWKNAAASTVAEENSTALSAASEESLESCEPVSAVDITGNELASDVTQLSVVDSESALDKQLQQQWHDVGKELESVVTSDVTMHGSCAQSDNTTDITAASDSMTHSTGNIDSADVHSDDGDDDDEEDNWEKMFDDAGEMLHHSGETQVNDWTSYRE